MEGDFQLDSRLQNDCTVIGELSSGSLLLLHNNAAVVWFIVVPNTAKTELFELSSVEQKQLLEEINRLSLFLKEQHNCDKINVATIGNIVSQLHIHIIGRSKDDPYWPGVVWGEAPQRKYGIDEVAAITRDIEEKLGITPFVD